MNKGYLSSLSLGCTLGLVATGSLSAQAAIPLTVDQTISEVLARNFTLKVAELDPEIAAQGVRQAEGSFDPVLSGEYRYDRSENSFSASDNETAQASLGVSGDLPWGTQYDASVAATDSTEPFGAFFDPLNPDTEVPQILTSVSSRASITVTQPILRGFGRTSRGASLALAENTAEQSTEVFRATLINTVTEAINAHYTLLLARENLAVAEQNRDLAARLLADNRRRVEEGVLAPLDLVQAESEIALREVSVVQAARQARLAENRLRLLLGDDPATVLDRELTLAPVPEMTAANPDPRRDFVQALEQRPDMRLARLSLEAEDIREKQAIRDERPQLDLFASYGLFATEESLSDSVSELGDGQAAYSLGARFSLSFPNRTRDALRVSASLRRNQAELELRQREQSVMVLLDNAANRVETDWQRIQAARQARELAERALVAEEKKLQAGTTSTFIVLRLQGDLADARVREIGAVTDYAIALAEYDAALGLTLVRRNISVQ